MLAFGLGLLGRKFGHLPKMYWKIVLAITYKYMFIFRGDFKTVPVLLWCNPIADGRVSTFLAQNSVLH